jgi:hypothetical protein
MFRGLADVQRMGRMGCSEDKEVGKTSWLICRWRSNKETITGWVRWVDSYWLVEARLEDGWSSELTEWQRDRTNRCKDNEEDGWQMVNLLLIGKSEADSDRASGWSIYDSRLEDKRVNWAGWKEGDWAARLNCWWAIRERACLIEKIEWQANYNVAAECKGSVNGIGSWPNCCW